MKKRTTLVSAALSAAMILSLAPGAHAEPATDDSIMSDETPTTDVDTDVEEADEDEEEDDQLKLDPTKDMWDKGDASSKTAPDGPFDPDSSSGLNRAHAYVNSNHFKMLTLISTAVGGVLLALFNFAAILISANPELKDRFAAMFPA